MDDEAGGEDIFTYAKFRHRVLDAVQLGHVAGCLGDDVEPELVVKVVGLLPFVGRKADSAGAGACLDLDVADVLPTGRRFGDVCQRKVVFDKVFDRL